VISFDLDEEQAAIKEMVHKFATTEIRPNLREWEKEGALSDEFLQKYHELGLKGLEYPEEYGGGGLDMRMASVIVEELSWGDVGVATALPGPGGAGYAILELGTEEQRKRYLPEIFKAGAEVRWSLAIRDDSPIFDLQNMSTTAERTGEEWVIRGKKSFVEGGASSSLFVVMANADGAVESFVVHRDTSGIKIGKRHEMMGLETAEFSEVSFEDCRVGENERLSGAEDRAKAIQAVINRLRVIYGARAVGLARASAEYAFQYSTERVAFQKTLKDHQALSFMMADMATLIDSARWMLWRAAFRLDTDKYNATEETRLACRHIREMLDRVLPDAVQILGGHGYIKDHPVEKWMRDGKTIAAMIEFE
jgi:acyl-CoA dehydrogenase